MFIRLEALFVVDVPDANGAGVHAEPERHAIRTRWRGLEGAANGGVWRRRRRGGERQACKSTEWLGGSLIVDVTATAQPGSMSVLSSLKQRSSQSQKNIMSMRLIVNATPSRTSVTPPKIVTGDGKWEGWTFPTPGSCIRRT